MAPAVVVKADDFVAWLMDTSDAFTGLATEAGLTGFIDVVAEMHHQIDARVMGGHF